MYYLGTQMFLCSHVPQTLQTLGFLCLPFFDCLFYVNPVVDGCKESRENSRKLVGRFVDGFGNEAEFGKITIFLAVFFTFAFLILLFWFPSCLFIFLSPETPFHFTLPKEGDIIPPLTGATPPPVRHLKLEPRRHSTPIGKWVKCNAFKAEFLRYYFLCKWFLLDLRNWIFLIRFIFVLGRIRLWCLISWAYSQEILSGDERKEKVGGKKKK